jgi:hypothetical protein
MLRIRSLVTDVIVHYIVFTSWNTSCSAVIDKPIVNPSTHSTISLHIRRRVVPSIGGQFTVYIYTIL